VASVAVASVDSAAAVGKAGRLIAPESVIVGLGLSGSEEMCCLA
jgi:hypothetical protein